MKALIVGMGRVGQAFARIARPLGWSCEPFEGREADSSFKERLNGVDIVVLAIPAKNHGGTALSYILTSLNMGVPVVTCEKSALAYHFDTLKPHLGMLGITATVGGGSGMLKLAETSSIEPIQSVHVILNATLNFICSRLGESSIEESMHTAQYIGLAEPNATRVTEAFAIEMRDAMMKSCILFDLLGLGKNVSPDDFEMRDVSLTELQMLERASDIRFVVSITPAAHEVSKPLSDPFSCTRSGWVIRGKFTGHIKLLFGMRVVGAQNALLLSRQSGNELIIGVGAGPIPTASAMLEDAKRLLSARLS